MFAARGIVMRHILSTFEIGSVLLPDNTVVTLEYLTTLAIAIRNAGAKYRDFRAEESVKEDIHSQAFREESSEMIDCIRQSGLYERRQMKTFGVEDDQDIFERLRSRLIDCNLKRRSRINHASQHSKKLRGSLPPMNRYIVPTKVDDASGASKRLDIPEVSPKIFMASAQVTDTGILMTTSPSKASTAPTSFDREDFKMPYPDNRDKELGTTVESPGSFVARKLTMEYPRPPKVAIGSRHFECPCCHLILPIDHIEENLWRYVSDLSIYMYMAH